MPVIYMDRASIESLTEKDIRDIVDANATDMKYGMLYDYYVGKHRILDETKKDSTAPNNRLVNNMARYIIDTATGYFVGQPGSKHGSVRACHGYQLDDRTFSAARRYCHVCGVERFRSADSKNQ